MTAPALLVVIPCGGKKLTRPAPAGELYVGSYHRACRMTADALRPDRILILSALHGLVELDRVLAPYDLRMGRPGSVGVGTVLHQAQQLGVTAARRIVAFGGRPYVTLAREVWPDLVAPLEGCSGMGEQLGRMARIRAAGHP